MDAKLVKLLNRAADFIESACYDDGYPVIINSDGIVILSDQCRFYAKPASHQEIRLLQQERFGKVDHAYQQQGNAFRNISTIRSKTKYVIKGNLGLPEGADFGISIGGGFIVFDFSLSDIVGEDYFRKLVISSLGPSRPNHIVVGKTLDGEEVVVRNESSKHHHILIAGSSGSGKTTLGNTLLYGLASAYKPSELGVFIMSGKQADVMPWSDLPHLMHEPTADPDIASAILAWVEEERDRRSKLPPEGKRDLPRLVVYIGEIADLIASGSPEIGKRMDSLMRLGRSEKIHLYVTTQRPKVDRVGGGDAKGQFRLVMCGAMQNPTDAYIAIGHGDTQAEYLPGRGAFITSNSTRFQAAFAGDEEDYSNITRLISELRAKYQDNQKVVLDVRTAADVRSSDMTKDVIDFANHIIDRGIEETTKSYIQTAMGWGYPRSNRVWLRLVDDGIIEERESKNKAASIDLELLKEKRG